MNPVATLFISTFTTLLAIINPLESLPVFLRLMEGKDRRAHRLVARRACTYATLLLFFFLIFGTLLLEIFEVPLSMVRIVGGIILMRIGFSLFIPSAGVTSAIASAGAGGDGDVAFVPLAMPLMFGPGAIATVLGMASLVRHPFTEVASLIAIVAPSWRRWVPPICSSPMPTRSSAASARAASTQRPASSVFFVSAMGMGLIFHGVAEAIRNYVLGGPHCGVV
jgi:multiple antibiotic resistance protein